MQKDMIDCSSKLVLAVEPDIMNDMDPIHD